MGNVSTCLASTESSGVEVDGVSCGVCVHQYLFPMYVVKDGGILRGNWTRTHECFCLLGYASKRRGGSRGLWSSFDMKIGMSEPRPRGIRLSADGGPA